MRMCLCVYKYMYLFKQVYTMILIFGVTIIGYSLIVAIKIIKFTIIIIKLV